MATAELDIRIRSGDVPNATRELKRLESQGLSTERGMGSLASASKKTGSAIEALSGALAGVGFVVAARDAMALADKFNAVAGKAAKLGLLKGDQTNIQRYVTGKALDGLYLMIGEEERNIRRDPVGTGSAIATVDWGQATVHVQ